jgi:hypothetical protein
VVLLVVGAALGLGGLKAAHKLHLTTTSSVAQASAGYDLDAPTAATVEGRDLFVANGAGNSVTEINGNARTLIRIISGPSSNSPNRSRWPGTRVASSF